MMTQRTFNALFLPLLFAFTNDLLSLVLEWKEQRTKKETGLSLSAGPIMLSFYPSTNKKNKNRKLIMYAVVVLCLIPD